MSIWVQSALPMWLHGSGCHVKMSIPSKIGKSLLHTPQLGFSAACVRVLYLRWKTRDSNNQIIQGVPGFFSPLPLTQMAENEKNVVYLSI